MRINRGDRHAGVDALRLRSYFRRYSANVNIQTAMEVFSMTEQQAQKMLDGLLKLEMISPCKSQHDKKIVCYETTITGNGLRIAKASAPVKRATAERILQELLERVNIVNERQDLAYRVASVVVFGSLLSEAAHVEVGRGLKRPEKIQTRSSQAFLRAILLRNMVFNCFAAIFEAKNDQWRACSAL